MSARPGLAIMWSAGVLRVLRADLVVEDAGGRVLGATFGDIDPPKARLVVQALARGNDPGPNAPVLPWAAVSVRSDGSLACAVSTMLPSGLFWARDDDLLVVATDPEPVVRNRIARTTVDTEHLRTQLLRRSDARRTPLAGVRRIPAGITATWTAAPRGPLESPWIGADVWGGPDQRVETVPADYLAVVDHVLMEVAGPDTHVAVAMSGGLDSTFLAASLARICGSDRPVQAFVHRPLPEASLHAHGRWDPDEGELAAALARAYPGQILLTSVMNEERVQPIDAAERVAIRSWLPSPNPSNEVWVEAIADRARAAGVGRLVIGPRGNAAFSYSPPRALRWRGRLRRAVGAATGRDPRGSLTETNSRDFAMLTLGVSMTDEERRRPTRSPRVEHLALLAGLEGSGRGAGSPAARGDLPVMDPFAARPVLDLAARLSPDAWRWNGQARGLARRLGEGRVPDVIRLRTQRGAQAWDTWFVMHGSEDRYRAEAEALYQTPDIGDWLDPDAMARQIGLLPWGHPTGPTHAEVSTLNAVLHMAAYARLTSIRLDQEWAARRPGWPSPH